MHQSCRDFRLAYFNGMSTKKQMWIYVSSMVCYATERQVGWG